MRMVCLKHYDSPLGGITMAASDDALTGLWFDGQRYFGDGLGEEQIANGDCDLPIFDSVSRWLDEYFSGTCPGALPLIRPAGTAFRQLVWCELMNIPYGIARTYGEIAALMEQKTGKRVSARAVGNAVGHNPISILIPCHRVIGSNGKLTGYAGGLERKECLLNLEKGRGISWK